jgi:hypothetical protein
LRTTHPAASFPTQVNSGRTAPSESTQRSKEEAMDPAAVVTFVVIAGIVWGGFLLIASTAIKSESRKARKS